MLKDVILRWSIQILVTPSEICYCLVERRVKKRMRGLFTSSVFMDLKWRIILDFISQMEDKDLKNERWENSDQRDETSSFEYFCRMIRVLKQVTVCGGKISSAINQLNFVFWCFTYSRCFKSFLPINIWPLWFELWGVYWILMLRSLRQTFFIFSL